jgi:hypothetical protein
LIEKKQSLEWGRLKISFGVIHPQTLKKESKAMGIIIWLVLCVCVGAVANERGRSGGGFFCLSLILSPLIGIIMVMCMGKQ